MPRAPRKATPAKAAKATTPAAVEKLESQSLPGMDDLGRDPAPSETPRRGRPRAVRKVAETLDRAVERAASPPAKGPGRPSKAAVAEQVKAELYAYASLALIPAQMACEECAGLAYDPVVVPTDKGPVEMDRLMGVIDRTVAMASRYPKVMAILAKSGPLAEAAVLGTLLKPVALSVWRAHGPNGHNHNHDQVEGPLDADQFPAYAA